MRGGQDRLARATLGRVPAEHRSGLEPDDLTIGVVHLGLGVFHRTHQVSFLERAALAAGETRWGVSAYSERSPAAAEMLAAQDGLYSLQVAGASGSSFTVLASLREARFASGDPLLCERLADPAVTLVTVTVTEKGYRHDPATRRLRVEDPELLADAAGRPPVTVVGQLVRGLERRAEVGAGLTVVSCDNLAENGRLLAGLIADFAALPGAEVAPGLAGFLERAVSFPSSVVDRISPAPTAADVAAATAALGVYDAAAVIAEPTAEWVIEDSFAGARPPLERAGVRLVPDVAPYAELKLRVLNGAHSATAWLGLLAGDETVAATLSRPTVAGFVAALIDEEIRPTLSVPPGVVFEEYADAVAERFTNPAITYTNHQVASDGGNKLPGRLLATVRACRAAGIVPRRTALVVAVYLRLLATGRDAHGAPLVVDDPIGATMRPPTGEAASPSEVVGAALAVKSVFGDLGEDEGFRRLLADAYASVARGGLEAVVAQ